MARPQGKDRRPLVLVAGAVVILGIVFAEIYGRRAAVKKNAPPPADTTAAAATSPDLDEDNQPDALPVRRLDGEPGGRIVIAAIAASGGYAGWAAHQSAAFEMESVIFDDRGAIAESRTDEVTLKWAPPPRARIEASDGSTVAGLGADGAWGAARGTDGRWQVGKGPGGWDPVLLRDHLRDTLWEFGLPFNLGDVDVALSLPAEVEGDSLDRVIATYSGAGDQPARVYELGFSRDPGDLVEVRWNSETGAGAAAGSKSSDDEDADDATPASYNTLLILGDYQRMGFTDRPLRRTLYRLDPDGMRHIVHEQRLSKFRWDPEMVEGFEAPAS